MSLKRSANEKEEEEDKEEEEEDAMLLPSMLQISDAPRLRASPMSQALF